MANHRKDMDNNLLMDIINNNKDMVNLIMEDNQDIKDMDKISGMEEVIQDISCMKKLQEKRLLSYLEHLSNQFLAKSHVEFCVLTVLD